MTTERNPGGDATGLLQSLHADANSLTRPENIGALVRKFVAGLLDAIDKASSGMITRELGVATAQANCNYYAGILTGRIPSDYSVDGKWFPAGLAAHIRKELDIEGEDEQVIAEAWASVTHHVFDIVHIEDEEESQKAVDELIRATIMLFSGLK